MKKFILCLLTLYVLFFVMLSEKYYFDTFLDKKITRIYDEINYILRFFNDPTFQREWIHEAAPSNPVRLDIVIPVVEKDLEVLPHTLSGIRNMIFHPIGKIYLLSPESIKIRQFAKDNNCEFVFEDSLFEKYEYERIKKYGGWIYQQFLKLAANKAVEQEYYLIIDADTVLIHPQIFIENPINQNFNPNESKCILNTNGFHYSGHKRFTKKALNTNFSYRQGFVIHHMLFRKLWVAEFKQEIEKQYNINWQEALLKLVEEDNEFGLSEYDLYATFIYNRHPEHVNLVAGANLTIYRDKLSGISDIKAAYGNSHKSISFHHNKLITVRAE